MSFFQPQKASICLFLCMLFFAATSEASGGQPPLSQWEKEAQQFSGEKAEPSLEKGAPHGKKNAEKGSPATNGRVLAGTGGVFIIQASAYSAVAATGYGLSLPMEYAALSFSIAPLFSAIGTGLYLGGLFLNAKVSAEAYLVIAGEIVVGFLAPLLGAMTGIFLANLVSQQMLQQTPLEIGQALPDTHLASAMVGAAVTGILAPTLFTAILLPLYLAPSMTE